MEAMVARERDIVLTTDEPFNCHDTTISVRNKRAASSYCF